jgi:1-acyl-sn-glycerol-3-phosphate acyltransferase
MPRFIVFTKLSGEGLRSFETEPERLPDMRGEVERLGGKVIEHYALLGPYHFMTVVDVRDNDAAHLLRIADRGAETSARSMLPAIDLKLFVRLLGQSTENTGPYRWQIGLPARVARRLIHLREGYRVDARKYFKPLTIVGGHHVDQVRGPAIFIANHASFMDGTAMYCALPKRYQHRIAFPAAADRFFIKGRKELRKQGWWFSLAYNSFPLKRGGGRAALAHADWLIEQGWSIGIFPEGARTSAHKLARFRHGPAILALTHDVPVIPMYLEGLKEIRPKGSQEMTAGPVSVRVGAAIRFAPGTGVEEATRTLHRAVERLGREAAEERRSARETLRPAPARPLEAVAG